MADSQRTGGFALALVVAIVGMLIAPSAALASSGWSTPVQIDSYQYGLDSISCPSASFCAATDAGGNALTFNGGSWSAPLRIDSSESDLKSVSCASSTFCAAIDNAGNALTFNGSSWTAPAYVDFWQAGTCGSDAACYSNQLNSVSCPSPSFCIAVDQVGNALTFNGTTWSAPKPVSGSDLTSVSCASPALCVAVDDAGEAFKFDGSFWSGPTILQVGFALASVSCPSSSFCVAVANGAYAFTFNGSSWSGAVDIDGGEPYTQAMSAVSCATPLFCVAVDNQGNMLTFNGSSWSTPQSIDNHSYVPTALWVSCASASFCAAVDGAGEALTYPSGFPPPSRTTQRGGVSLRPFGPGIVDVPFSKIYAFSVDCSPTPCHIRLTERAYAKSRRRHLAKLDRLRGPVITMAREPTPGQKFVVWFQTHDFRSSVLRAAVRRYGGVDLRIRATVTNALGFSTSSDRTITLEPAPLPVLIAGPFRGRRPTNIDISGDAGNIVTGLHWSSWTASSANGEGTSNIQGCVPDCASGTETLVPTSITLLNPVRGHFTKLVERRNGHTESFAYTPGHLPDNWPGDAS